MLQGKRQQESGGDHMLHSEPEQYANWKTMKFASAAAAMALLAGCAVAVPLRP
jgi:hypothetical protein